MNSIKKSDFSFELAEEQIAKYPLEQRDQSKLLCYKNGLISHHVFTDVASLIQPNTLLVMNNAKVIPARLYFKRSTGAQIEVLLLEPFLPSSYEEAFIANSSCQWKCMVGNSKKWKNEESIDLLNQPELLQAKWIHREEGIVEFTWSNGLLFTSLLHNIGELPLPPYLNRKTEQQDNQTYQTVFAKNEGSVAAPTAGLHFTHEVLGNLSARGAVIQEVTLHVGAGTFLPVKTDDVLDHAMHREFFEVTLDAIDGLINHTHRIAVGTTSLRVLESLYWIGVQLIEGNHSLFVPKLYPYESESIYPFIDACKEIKNYMLTQNLSILSAATEILILPHYTIRSIDAMITNFHLPESTLLMLIASIVGEDWKMIYENAKWNRYRFLSYGDSSILFMPKKK